MAKTIQTAIEAGSRMAPAKFYIKITPDGPYLLYGNPPMDQEIIVPNDEGSSWTYRKGNHFRRQRSLRLYADAEHPRTSLIAMAPIIIRTGTRKRRHLISLIGRCRRIYRANYGTC